MKIIPTHTVWLPIETYCARHFKKSWIQCPSTSIWVKGFIIEYNRKTLCKKHAALSLEHILTVLGNFSHQILKGTRMQRRMMCVHQRCCWKWGGGLTCPFVEMRFPLILLHPPRLCHHTDSLSWLKIWMGKCCKRTLCTWHFAAEWSAAAGGKGTV